MFQVRYNCVALPTQPSSVKDILVTAKKSLFMPEIFCLIQSFLKIRVLIDFIRRNYKAKIALQQTIREYHFGFFLSYDNMSFD